MSKRRCLKCQGRLHWKANLVKMPNAQMVPGLQCEKCGQIYHAFAGGRKDA